MVSLLDILNDLPTGSTSYGLISGRVGPHGYRTFSYPLEGATPQLSQGSQDRSSFFCLVLRNTISGYSPFLVLGRSTEIFLQFVEDNPQYASDTDLFAEFYYSIKSVRNRYPHAFAHFMRESVAINLLFLKSPELFLTVLSTFTKFRLAYFFKHILFTESPAVASLYLGIVRRVAPQLSERRRARLFRDSRIVREMLLGVNAHYASFSELPALCEEVVNSITHLEDGNEDESDTMSDLEEGEIPQSWYPPPDLYTEFIDVWSIASAAPAA